VTIKQERTNDNALFFLIPQGLALGIEVEQFKRLAEQDN